MTKLDKIQMISSVYILSIFCEGVESALIEIYRYDRIRYTRVYMMDHLQIG